MATYHKDDLVRFRLHVPGCDSVNVWGVVIRARVSTVDVRLDSDVPAIGNGGTLTRGQTHTVYRSEIMHACPTTREVVDTINAFDGTTQITVYSVLQAGHLPYSWRAHVSTLLWKWNRDGLLQRRGIQYQQRGRPLSVFSRASTWPPRGFGNATAQRTND